MMSSARLQPRTGLTDLPWLPSAAVDFSERVGALTQVTATTGAELQRLATARLSRGQASRLGRALERCRATGTALGLPAFRLGIASNATMDIAADLVPAAGLRHRVAVELVIAAFGQVAQHALDPNSVLNTAQCDGVLLALDHRAFQLGEPRLDDGAAFVDRQAEQLTTIVRALRRHSGTLVILQTLAQPPEPLFGSFDQRVVGTVRWMISRMNEAIWRIAGDEGASVLDVAALAEQVGTQVWFDPPEWFAYKMPFSGTCGAIYAEWLARLIGAIRGNARKCLVLDLDNTCWGGVIGDDGIDGIRIGEGSSLGEAHLAVQRLALQLRERGIILAVASKNDDAVARGPFRELDHMLLREDHIAAFQANWIDKPANLKAIARTLNIGTDALVMLDDNPAERAMIRAAMPEVAVPELPSDPAQFTRILSAAGYFEANGFSQDDRIRAQSYAAQAQRAEVRASTESLEDYLQSLEMVISMRPFDSLNRARITQLINKTNQFNLTTRRHSEAQVEAFERDPGCQTLQVRLRDRFGDMGIIGAVIARQSGDILDVETWVMSCRVLGRKVEDAMLAQLVAQAREIGLRRITARYVPTAKNGMVRDLFDRLGLGLEAETADGERVYGLDVADAPYVQLPMQAETNKVAA